ncbi:MAG: hypothetical protein KY475_08825 [Planctomycetes bacterium]|nr:hypothetical protein [Planctomycetota bacterium]
MRCLWLPPLCAAIVFSSAVQGQQPQPLDRPAAQAPENPADSAFPARQPLGAFQPTDIGLGNSQPEAEPEPPGILSPDPQAAPADGQGDRSVLVDEPQTVAPAQFQSPAAPKKTAEPKTRVVPGAAPAFQPVEPETPPHQPESPSLSQSLYQQAITPPASGALAGSPLTLHEALVRRADAARYAEFVKAYWTLSRSLASYYESVQGASELSRLPQSRLPVEQALLQAARASAEAELRQWRLEAQSAQHDLAEQFSATPSDAPLPADLPLVSAYKSKFEAVFAGRTPPRGARRLHETFDARLSLIEARAGELVAVENAYASLADAYAAGQSPLDTVLRQHARLQASRHAFLRSVYDYNASIAEYAYHAAGPNRSPETIASMLVERKKTDNNIAPANFAAPR